LTLNYCSKFLLLLTILINRLDYAVL